MHKSILLLPVALGLALAGCGRDDAQEKRADQIEDQADAVRASADAKADAMEDKADRVRNASPSPTTQP
ncbi:MAG TPA: hypothetical protein PLL44_03755 [Novosphingobium sp.]|jgi:hypothetical protein|nr:hypothetical protein [Novosphingobium sp.]HQN53524.1 hypothetical protein [Novosphingobium sp.]HQQ07425.1 hypothetical protein [Novosphingobium sp.]